MSLESIGLGFRPQLCAYYLPSVESLGNNFGPEICVQGVSWGEFSGDTPVNWAAGLDRRTEGGLSPSPVGGALS